MPTFGLGRNFAADARDYSVAPLLEIARKAHRKRNRVMWGTHEWWGNQYDTPHCVGYALAHWLEDGPVTHEGPAPIVSPEMIYSEAQKIDEWPGEDYDGTSVRAGAKVLQNLGYIESYWFGTSIDELIDMVLYGGPIVVGTNWYDSMFETGRLGHMGISGDLVGGHAYVLNGVNLNTQKFRIKNSWGQEWGWHGFATISISDMSRLLREDGEAMLAVERADAL